MYGKKSGYFSYFIVSQDTQLKFMWKKYYVSNLVQKNLIVYLFLLNWQKIMTKCLTFQGGTGMALKRPQGLLGQNDDLGNSDKAEIEVHL
jgi:hypothetical protein